MRLETPTQVVMSKVNRGNIHTFFFFFKLGIACVKESGKTTCKPLGTAWLHCILLGAVLQDQSLSISQRHRVSQQVLCVPRGADISNVLIPSVLEDHQHITPQLPFQPAGTADSIIPGTAFMLELRISSSRATFQKKTNPLNYVAKDTANIPLASK